MAESTTLEPPGAATTAVVTTKESSSTPFQEPSFDKELLASLAKQLEYYFSDQNLRRDTYLSTLRELNDGCVPATILGNFSKVQALAGSDFAYYAVLRAARDYSDDLLVAHVDKDTGKQVDEESTQNTLLCVGTKTRKPISSLKATTKEFMPAVALTPPVQTTIIFRDVPATATEATVRQCFDFEPCPYIASVHEDVANCWFVTLDASCSRDDMVKVMLELRSKTIDGESVKARLKTASTVLNASAPVYSGDRNFSFKANGTKKKQMHQKSLTPPLSKDNKKVRRSVNQLQSPIKKNEINTNAMALPPLSQFPSLGEYSKKEPSSSNNTIPPPPPPPPPPPVNQFPSLGEDDKLDGGSTTTTTSSTSLEPVTAVGGYAAALLKPKPPTPPPPIVKKVVTPEKEKTVPQTNGAKKQGNGKKQHQPNKPVEKKLEHEKKIEPKEETPKVKDAPKSVPMPWGGGKTFADVVKL